MDAAIGFIFCGILPLLLMGIAGYVIMNRRIGALQARLAQVEQRLPSRDTLAQAPGLEAVTAAAPIAAPAADVAPSLPLPEPLPSASPLASQPVSTAPALPPASLPPSSLPGAARTERKRWSAPPLIDWFLRMHVLVQIGLVVLFIGVALLLRYAVDQGWLSIEIRHIGAAVGGVALGVAGWAVRGGGAPTAWRWRAAASPSST